MRAIKIMSFSLRRTGSPQEDSSIFLDYPYVVIQDDNKQYFKTKDLAIRWIISELRKMLDHID